jgi:hypothetical protein
MKIKLEVDIDFSTQFNGNNVPKKNDEWVVFFEKYLFKSNVIGDAGEYYINSVNNKESLIFINSFNIKAKKINVKSLLDQIPTYDEFQDFALSKMPNVDLSHLKFKYQSWIQNEWKNGNNKKILNWKSSLINTLPFLKTVELKSNKMVR